MTKKKIKTHKIALYIRVSTEDQAANPEGSLKSQEQRLRNHVGYRNQESHFGDVTHVFIDRAKSGKDTNRPELQKLLKAIREDEVTLVLVTELSRLSRSIKDFAGIWELMRAHNCAFQSLRENFDTTTSAGEMMLYSMANLAQFERRQISERVSANFLARAQRGLYNGGCVPMGYKLDSDKKGYLIVDPEYAEVVRAAFRIFIEEGSLKKAGKVLNDKGYRLNRTSQGGSTRLGFFTIDNLYRMLTNKSYLGIRIYDVQGEQKETKANWEPIVERKVFDRANEILKKNHRTLKSNNRKKYPYLLSGKLFCGVCRDRLCGKSANGNGGKIAYYEHSWLTKKQAYLTKKVYSCNPNRVLAKLVEPVVWSEILKLLSQPILAENIIQEAQKLHGVQAKVSDRERIQSKAKGVEAQAEALAEHLSKIPKDVSPTPIFTQMKKLEAIKEELEKELQKVIADSRQADLPIGFKTYESYLKVIRLMLVGDFPEDFRNKIIDRLIYKVELMPNGLRIHWHVGESNFVCWEPGSGDDKNFKRTKSNLQKEKGSSNASLSIFLSKFGSNTLTNGWGGRIRTCE
jgi:DNA invertase Pin-like site-specific DNA recombinase